MNTPPLIDEASCTFRAGRGGDGLVSFHRTRSAPRGGPDGGNGARGGGVVLRADANIADLAGFVSQKEFCAKAGEQGGKRLRSGASAEDLVLKVPPGTRIWEGEHIVADITQHGQTLRICRGGGGGKGNAFFRAPHRRAPHFAEHGEAGQERQLRLEMALIADIGFVGEPNAGKSTLLRAVSASQARVGSFPFTTLRPNLGVVIRTGSADAEEERLLACDLPGLVKDARLGKGLGHRFLRHAQRVGVLALVVPAAPSCPVQQCQQLREELLAFSPDFASRAFAVVLSKTDLLPNAAAITKLRKQLEKAMNAPVFALCAHSGAGIAEAIDGFFALHKQEQTNAKKAQEEANQTVILRPSPAVSTGPAAAISQHPSGGWQVCHARLERQANRLPPDSDEARAYFMEVLEKRGIVGAIKKRGGQSGDPLQVGHLALLLR